MSVTAWGEIESGVEGHKPAVGLLRVTVETDCLFQHFDCRVLVACVFLVLRQSGMRVESAAVEIVSDRLKPGVVATLEKVTEVGVDRTS